MKPSPQSGSLTYPSPPKVSFCSFVCYWFLLKRTLNLKIHPLNKFWSIQYWSVNSRAGTTVQQSLELKHPAQLKLHTYWRATPYFSSPPPGNHHSSVCFYESDYFRFITEGRSCSISSVIRALHLAEGPPGSSMSSHTVESLLPFCRPVSPEVRSNALV